ncbi:GNAT family N-acetyltransferase [Pseudoflavonifractor sp. MSJ-37]|uniref:GNAT family N-acetyltransferase n=1 Tax=Pseudoflavonifractor sp. MSJ-37 TaxID=2841531 RepID=UPI001C0FF956|nr:GNAT family N-acetyltransferase [Pseudoflavonifractor sp. MSJ-37]MBU5435512.1 GNAT family N-acetyltransferase [Pseudoflavonifractor sp. MSJ-37]
MTEYHLLDAASLPPFLPFFSSEWQAGLRSGLLTAAGAVEDGVAVGAAAFQRIGADARLDYIAVSPDFQRQGIATGLLSYLRTVLPLLDCDTLWTDLVHELGPDSPGARLLASLGAQAEQGPAVISCPVSALLTSPMLSPLLEKEFPSVLPLRDVPLLCLRECQSLLHHTGITAAPLDWETFDPDLSFCGLNAQQEIDSCVCTLRQAQDISVEWIYAAPGRTKQLIFSVVALLQTARTQLPPDARFSAVLLHPRLNDLLVHLAGDAVTYRYATRWTWDLLADIEPE